MKIRYDGEGDTLGLFIKDEQIHHAEEYGQIVINYNKNNEPVEIEILSASKFFGEFLTSIMQAKPKAKLIEVGS